MEPLFCNLSEQALYVPWKLNYHVFVEARWGWLGLGGCDHSPVSFLHPERKRSSLWTAPNPYIRKVGVSVSEMLFTSQAVCDLVSRNIKEISYINPTMQIKPLSQSVTQSSEGFPQAEILNSQLFLHGESWHLTSWPPLIPFYLPLSKL